MTASHISRTRRRTRRRDQGQTRGSTRRRMLFGLAGMLVLLIAFAGGVAGGAGLYAMARYDEIAEGVVPPQELIDLMPRGGAKIYDRHGELLYEYVDELSGLRRPVTIDQISEWVIKATISTEDASFYENNGLNMRGLVRAGVENFAPVDGGEFLQGSGGSSITQQLAKNIYIPREERAIRDVERKIKETVIALELTQKYEKDQILEWYLNSISYSGIYVGIQAAAEGYFHKNASELNLAEAALLAGIPQSPAVYNPLRPEFLTSDGRLVDYSPAKVRQGEVLDLMVRHGAITEAEADAARAVDIVFKPARFDVEAPHFIFNRLEPELVARFGHTALREQGLQIYTTIDMNMQREFGAILDSYLEQYGDQSNVHNAAATAMDPRTGQILVWLGSVDYWNDEIEGRNDNITALNSPGSTLKPFVFLANFLQGWSTGTGILDVPTSVVDPSTGTTFTPRNPGTGFQGIITARLALGNSLNVTATKAIQAAGVNETIDLLTQLGYTGLGNQSLGVALPTGGVDITLEDQMIGYGVLATGGVMRGQDLVSKTLEPGERTIEPIAILRVLDADGGLVWELEEPVEQRVIPASAAWLVTSILSDGSTQCITFGVCGALALPNGYPSASKTGTSEPFETIGLIGETWTMGYTPGLVAGVWAGNADNDPLVNITSTRVSHRSWMEFMVWALDYLEEPPIPFERPPGIEERELCWPSGRLPSDICPSINRYNGLFIAEALPRTEEERQRAVDNWWQMVPIDMRTGLLAAPNTPAQFVQEQLRLVFPEDEVRGWTAMEEWAARHNVLHMLAPRETSSADMGLVNIMIPSANQTLSGDVQIFGSAQSEEFRTYNIEWGRGASPTSWVQIYRSGAPVTNNILGVWNTQTVPDGQYTLRVVVEDARRGTLQYRVQVYVANGIDGIPDDRAPVIQLEHPREGALLEGIVQITGLAASGGQFQEYVVEVGAGPSPQSWTEIGRRNQMVITGTLATWDTRSMPNGAYTLRITARDGIYGSTQIHLMVFVNNPE